MYVRQYVVWIMKNLYWNMKIEFLIIVTWFMTLNNLPFWEQW